MTRRPKRCGACGHAWHRASRCLADLGWTDPGEKPWLCECDAGAWFGTAPATEPFGPRAEYHEVSLSDGRSCLVWSVGLPGSSHWDALAERYAAANPERWRVEPPPPATPRDFVYRISASSLVRNDGL